MNTEQNNYEDPKYSRLERKSRGKLRNILGATALLAASGGWVASGGFDKFKTEVGNRINERIESTLDPVSITEMVQDEDGILLYGLDEEGNRYARISTIPGYGDTKTLIGEGVSQRYVQDTLRDNGLTSVPSQGERYWVREDFLTDEVRDEIFSTVEAE